jgi:DNA polymerase-1
LQEILLSQEKGGFMILQVHDELIFDVPADAIEKLAKTVNDVMSSVYPLSVPLKVDLQTGPNWYELEKIELNQD